MFCSLSSFAPSGHPWAWHVNPRPQEDGAVTGNSSITGVTGDQVGARPRPDRLERQGNAPAHWALGSRDAPDLRVEVKDEATRSFESPMICKG